MNVENWIEELRSEDSEEMCAAFENLRRTISTAKDQVYKAAIVETDPHARGALVELLGDSKDAKYLRFIEKKLRYDIPVVKFWAYAALSRIGTPDALKIRDEYHFHDLVKNLPNGRVRG